MNVFISYPRIMDDFGAVTGFKTRLNSELNLLESDSSVFLDTNDIDTGEIFPEELIKAIAEADILVIMVAPAWFQSQWCRKEYFLFTSKEGGDWSKRVVPVLWVETPSLHDSDDPIAIALRQTQYDNWCSIRSEGWDAPETNTRVKNLASSIQARIKTVTQLVKTPYGGTPRIYAVDMPIPGSKQFCGRVTELNRLCSYLNDATVNVVAVVAPAGVGKTHLLLQWLKQLRPDYQGTCNVFFWTFYIQRTHDEIRDSGSFFLEALRFFRVHSSNDQVTDLISRIQEKKTLIVLDGIEPLQSPTDSEAQGRFLDSDLRTFISAVTRDGLSSNGGLVVVTSRQRIVEIEHYENQGYQVLGLDTLSDSDGAMLLRDLEVEGTDDDLKDASRELGGHCLALVLLGNLVRETTPDKSIASLHAMPSLFEDPNQGGHALRVMKYYDETLWPAQEGSGKQALFLRLLGLFDRPVDYDEIELIEKQVPRFQELDARVYGQAATNRLYESLVRAGLLSIKKSDEPVRNWQWDTHALVRQYFGGLLRRENPNSWVDAHKTLFAFYENKPEEQFPDDIESIKALYRAIRHGCLAGEYRATFELYKKRISRGNAGFSTTELGAAKQDIGGLSCFFHGDMEKVVTDIEAEDHIFLLGRAAFCLQAVGRINRAIDLRLEQIDLCKERQKRVRQAESTVYLANAYLARGNLRFAEKAAKEGIELADKCRHWRQKLNGQAELAAVLFRKGDLEGANKWFHAAEELQREKYPEDGDFLHSGAGSRYCSLLLACARDDNDRRNVLERALELLRWEESHHPWKVAEALGHAAIGRALIAIDFERDKNIWKARAELDRAVEIISHAGAIDEHPRVLLTRARFYLVTREWGRARADLDYVFEIVGHCDLDLYRVEYFIEKSHLLLDVALSKSTSIEYGVLREMQSNIVEAARLIDRWGYHLKDPELKMVQARLAFRQGQLKDAKRHIEDAEAKMNRMGYMVIKRDIEAIKREFS